MPGATVRLVLLPDTTAATGPQPNATGRYGFGARGSGLLRGAPGYLLCGWLDCYETWLKPRIQS